MSDDPREISIVNAVIKHIESLGGRAVKNHGTAYGHPTVDILGCLQGRMLQIEVKRPGKKATRRQLLCLRNWASAGAITGVVTSVDEARDLLMLARYA